MLVSVLEGSRCERLRIGTKNLLSRDGEESVSLRGFGATIIVCIRDVKPVVPYEQ